MNPLVAKTFATVAPTIEYLLHLEEYKLAQDLVLGLAKRWPQDDPAVTDFIAMVLHRSKAYRDALPYAERTVRLMPDHMQAQYNYAKCLNSAGHPTQAEAIMRTISGANPQSIDARLDLALYISMQGRFDEALEILESSLPLAKPGTKEHDLLTFNLGWYFHRQNRFKEGMAALSVGRKYHIWGAFSREMSRPRLARGIDLKGKTLLFFGEGGLGDEMINARFAQTAVERGARVIWTGQPALLSIVARVPGISEVVTQEDSLKTSYDYWVPPMDAPHILDLDSHELPREPYITPDAVYMQSWRERVPDRGRLRVGLRWQGNPLFEQDLYRSVPFRQLEPLLSLEGADFYSLQRDSGVDEIPPGARIVNLEAELKSMEDTAAAIAQLDLVITTCTSIAHLAGAMGKTTWVLAPLNCYYIWAAPGERSPWYKDVTLFRQTRYHDWTNETQKVERALRAFIKDGR